jgi:hypothetical protein
LADRSADNENVDGIPDIEDLDERGEVVGIRVHVVSTLGLDGLCAAPASEKRCQRVGSIVLMPLEIKLDRGDWRCAADQGIAFGRQIQRFRRVGDIAFDQAALAVVAYA